MPTAHPDQPKHPTIPTIQAQEPNEPLSPNGPRSPVPGPHQSRPGTNHPKLQLCQQQPQRAQHQSPGPDLAALLVFLCFPTRRNEKAGKSAYRMPHGVMGNGHRTTGNMLQQHFCFPVALQREAYSVFREVGIGFTLTLLYYNFYYIIIIIYKIKV